MIILYIIANAFLILSIIFFMGKGAFLISGYNTASATEKKQYNKKRLTRVMGFCVGIIGLSIFPLGLPSGMLPSWLFILVGVIFFANIITTIILLNTYAKIKPNEKPDEAKDSKSHIKTAVIMSVIFMSIISIFVSLMLFTGDINVMYNEDNINLRASNWGDYTIVKDEINSISYSESEERGTRTNGVGSLVHLAGNFNSDKFGDYTLYAYTNCQSSVIIETDERTVVIGLKTAEETEKLYQELKNTL